MKNYSALIFTLFISACSPEGTVFSNQPKIKLEKNKAEIIIYHPKEFTGSMAIINPDVKINGIKACSLPNGGYFTDSEKLGKIIISSTKALSFGTSKLEINANISKQYFIRITWNTDKIWATAGAGLVGEGVAEGISSHSGPFILEQVNEDIAESELQKLRFNTNCD